MMNIIDPITQQPLTNQQTNTTETLQFIPGIWVNGKYQWLQNGTEKIIYEEGITFRVKQEQVHSKIRFSSVYVGNHSNQLKEIKVLAMHHLSNVGRDHLTFFSPSDNRIFHHANKQVFLVNGQCQGTGIKDYTVMPLWSVYTDQIWASLQTGGLKYQPMAKGPAASIYAIKVVINPHETVKLNTWMISGSSKKELISMEQALLKNTLAFPFEK
jgi:GH15 family glucan-1,4-alpha-glucosidase